MSKHSVFVKNPGEAKWSHWGYFDTRRDAREECARQKWACASVKTRVVPTTINSDFTAIAEAMT